MGTNLFLARWYAGGKGSGVACTSMSILMYSYLYFRNRYRRWHVGGSSRPHRRAWSEHTTGSSARQLLNGIFSNSTGTKRKRTDKLGLGLTGAGVVVRSLSSSGVCGVRNGVVGCCACCGRAGVRTGGPIFATMNFAFNSFTSRPKKKD